jgi:hypothetical protein
MLRQGNCNTGVSLAFPARVRGVRHANRRWRETFQPFKDSRTAQGTLPTLGPVNPLGRDRDHTYAPACPFHTPFPFLHVLSIAPWTEPFRRRELPDQLRRQGTPLYKCFCDLLVPVRWRSSGCGGCM